MSLALEAVRHKPDCFFLMDDSSPLQDYGPYNRTGTLGGTLVKHPAVAKGAAYAPVVDNTHQVEITTPLFQAGKESEPFSVIANIAPNSSTGAVEPGSQLLISQPKNSSELASWGGTVGTREVVYMDVNGVTKPAVKFTNDSSGQMYSPTVTIDPTNSYRLRVKMMDTAWTTINNNQIYVGTYVRNGPSTNVGMKPVSVAGAPGGISTNHYVWYMAQPPINQWFEFELYIFGINTANTDMVNQSHGPRQAYIESMMFPDNTANNMFFRFLNWNNSTGEFRDIFVSDIEFEEIEKVTTNTWQTKARLSHAPQKIVSNQRVADGLTIDGTRVSFGTKYQATGDASANYDLGSIRSAQLIGVHTNNKNSLFVDGKLVAEKDISESQQKDTYYWGDTKLYSGKTDSGQSFAVNGLGLYGHALTQEQITSLSGSNLSLPSAQDIATQFGGSYFPTSKATSNIFVDQWWQTEEEWRAAVLNGVAVRDSKLVPQFDGDVSLPGSWMDNFSLASADTTSIYGVAFDWDGTGAIVEASLDAVTWVPVTKGVNVSVIPPGFNPTDKQLMVRVSFPGGVTNDNSYIDSLNAVGTRTDTTQQINGRTITLTKAYHQKDFKPYEFDEHWGAQVDSGGSIVLSADSTDTPVLPRTLEVWIKRTSSTVPTISVSGTQYRNGAADSSALVQGQWTLVHITSATDITGAITITGPAQVGSVITYPTTLSAAEVSAVASAYSGSNALRVGDNSVITITQTGDNANIYAHDWAILSAG